MNPHRPGPLPCLVFLTAAAAGITAGAASPPGSVPGYVRSVPPEMPAQREARHRRVAERREGTIVLVHRGAASLAPENTLEAYAAAMDYGADGCEVDIRRTQDGVLVLFHDDMLDHLTNGFGDVAEITYYELLSLRPAFRYGTATRETRPPTFAALLALARQRAMLLYLDVKTEGLDADIARLLEQADAWEHIVGLNTQTTRQLKADPRVKLLAFKGPGLYDGRRDVSPDAVKEQLARPGQMLMVDDPRVAARELGRPAYRPVPLPAGLREKWERNLAPSPDAERSTVPPVYLRRRASLTNPTSRPELLSLLRSGTLEERREPNGTAEYRLRRVQGILDRAWAAERLGELKWSPLRDGRELREAVELLEHQVRHRTLHPDWRLHGLDGAAAARALGRMGAVQSAPVLIEAFRRVDPELKRVENPQFASNPLAWVDFRTKMYVLPALGELRCEASKRFLLDYVRMDPAKAREFAPPQYEQAARSLLRQDLSQAEIEALIRSENSAVRGTAILECVDEPSPARRAALKAAAPWAVELPGRE